MIVFAGREGRWKYEVGDVGEPEPVPKRVGPPAKDRGEVEKLLLLDDVLDRLAEMHAALQGSFE